MHAEWKTLIELFGESQEQSDRLNNIGGAFFDTVYRTLIRDILLGIARLTDPLKTSGKDNLVLERLTQLQEVVSDQSLSARVSAKLHTIKAKAQPFRDYRNRYLAHLDLATSLGPGQDFLPGIKRQDVEGVLEAFADMFNVVEHTFRNSTVLFKKVAIPGGPRVLLKALKDAESWLALPFEERRRFEQSASAPKRDS